MDVELYVYDLSGGMARQYSMAIAGVQIDAIYHTAIVYDRVEYFFGQGIHRKIPGSTHHGRPMKVIRLGQTHLPNEVIQEYIQSLESIYTPESYDLFLHNCNNFSQDLAMFLVGKDIPEEIRNLPETFLRTPIGQMLRGQIDQSMRRMTQAPDAMSGQSVPTPQPKATTNGSSGAARTNVTTVTTTTAPQTVTIGPAEFINGRDQPFVAGCVHNITSTSELDRLLKSAESNCAVIFFTSATCPPCKIVYPAYDELAAEAGDKATLIKVDTSVAYGVSQRYQIRATPTFITFLKGKKDQEWSGAHEARLRGNVRLLIQMANPQHAHMRLRLPSFQSKIQKPIMYTRSPPFDKLMTKLGGAGQDRAVQDLINYIRQRDKEGLENVATPNLQSFTEWVKTCLTTLPPDVHFSIIDLVRIACADPRVSSYIVAEPDQSTLTALIPIDKDYSTASYNLQAVTLQLACNFFSSTVFQESLIPKSEDQTQSGHGNNLRAMIENLASTSFLSSHHNARSLAGALVYNLAAHDHNNRLNSQPDQIDLSTMPDLEAALVEAVVNESENKETLHALLMALGLLLFAAPTDSSSSSSSAIRDLCQAMDIREALRQKSKMEIFKGESLIREVGEELLAKGGC